MIKGTLRIKPTKNKFGYFDLKFFLTQETSGLTGFNCELNEFKLTTLAEHNALRLTISGYEKLARIKTAVFEVYPVSYIPGAGNIQTFDKLPTIEYFLGYLPNNQNNNGNKKENRNGESSR